MGDLSIIENPAALGNQHKKLAQFRMNRFKLALSNNQLSIVIALAVVLSVALGNIMLQFFFRSLVTDWLRMLWVSCLIFLILFPLNHWLVQKVRMQVPPINSTFI